MKTKFGAIIVAGSGKIGGHVASRNRAGSYLRTKVTPVNVGSVAQSTVRNRLAGLASGWSSLLPAQRLAWNASVADFAKTDVFGDLKNPSGFNLYIALNNNLLRAGQSVISSPPLPQSLPSIETGVLAAAHGGAITVTFTADPVETASKVEVWATTSMSPGISFVKSEFRRIGLMPALSSHVTTLTTIYNAKFGAVGAAGQKVFVGMKQISTVSGQAGAMVIYSAIIS